MQSILWENHGMPTGIISLCAKPCPFPKVLNAVNVAQQNFYSIRKPL